MVRIDAAIAVVRRRLGMKEQNGPHDLRAIAHKAMTDRGLEPDFPPEAVQQLHGIQGPGRETDGSIRDLRNLLWCSIDNDTSRDLDQLTAAQKLTAGRGGRHSALPHHRGVGETTTHPLRP